MATKDPWNRQPSLTEDFYKSNGAYAPNLDFLLPATPTPPPPTGYLGELGGAYGSTPALTGANNAVGVNVYSPRDFGPGIPFGDVGREINKWAYNTAPQIGYNIKSAITPITDFLSGQQRTPYTAPGAAPGNVLASKLGQDYQVPSLTGGNPYQTGGYTGPFGVTAGLPTIGGRILGAPDSNESQSQSLLPPPDNGGGGEQKQGGWQQVWKNGKLKWILIRNRNQQEKRNGRIQEKQRAISQGRSISQALNWRVATG